MKQAERSYLSGFGNELESEAPGFEGALPVGRYNPQKFRYNLFPEQLSGTAFTAPRGSNRRSWLYRMRPSVCHGNFKRLTTTSKVNFRNGFASPNQHRWTPFESDDLKAGLEVDFVEGLHTLAFSDSDGCAFSSMAIHIYLANSSMANKCFTNSDGDFLIVPQLGTLRIRTEFGVLVVAPNEIVVIQQGMKFSVSSEDRIMRGYILEVRGNHFELPSLGPIGANGLANPRDFLTPTAQVDHENMDMNHKIILKFQNELFEADKPKSPYDVAAWSGNYTPYKYSLDRFVSVNSVSVDHPDPSIFTVLTCPSVGKPGTALADFVIFPPRWECAQDTFRPPYYHLNCMTEFMGLIKGRYQAKNGEFAPGGASLHQSMLPHGPDAESFRIGTQEDTSVPRRVADGTMAFMFETCLALRLTEWALSCNLDKDYQKCWQDVPKIMQNGSTSS